MKRKATALWKGNGPEGKGILNAPSGFFNDTPYSAKTRFQNEDGKAGTNPEELIAAAHAGCFTMALSFALTQAGFTADELTTEATVTMDQVDGGFAITSIVLHLTGKVPGLDAAKFTDFANGAKVGCPVSKALSAVPISLEVNFEG